jgi:hypothetical protein
MSRYTQAALSHFLVLTARITDEAAPFFRIPEQNANHSTLAVTPAYRLFATFSIATAVL